MDLADLRYTVYDTDVGISKSVPKLDIHVFCYTHIMSIYFISEEHFVMIILTCALFSCMIFVNCI